MAKKIYVSLLFKEKGGKGLERECTQAEKQNTPSGGAYATKQYRKWYLLKNFFLSVFSKKISNINK
jgi:hypothetical protein